MVYRLSGLVFGIWLALAGFVVANAQEQSDQARIDHILWGVPDLDKGAEWLGRHMGVEPVYGGYHPGRGTANKLISVGPHTYLEIIGPDPRLDAAEGRGIDFANMEEGGIVTFAINIADADGVAERLAVAGIEFDGPTAGSRETPWGETLAWRSLTVRSEEFGDFVPFAIQWVSDNHPAASSPKGRPLQTFSIWHPNAAGLQRIYDVLGVPVSVKSGMPKIEAVFGEAKDSLILHSLAGN